MTEEAILVDISGMEAVEETWITSGKQNFYTNIWVRERFTETVWSKIRNQEANCLLQRFAQLCKKDPLFVGLLFLLCIKLPI